MSCDGAGGCGSGGSRPVPGALANGRRPGLVAAVTLRPGVPIPVMTRLALAEDQTTASEALQVGRCNSGCVDVVVFGFQDLSRIEIDVEGGSDRENWSRLVSALFTRSGFTRFRFRGVASRYVRLFYRAIGDPGGIGLLTTTLSGCELSSPGPN